MGLPGHTTSWTWGVCIAWSSGVMMPEKVRFRLMALCKQGSREPQSRHGRHAKYTPRLARNFTPSLMGRQLLGVGFSTVRLVGFVAPRNGDDDLQGGYIVRQPAEGDGSHAVSQVECVRTGMDDIQPFERQIGQSRVHRPGGPGFGGVLELKSQAASTANDQKIDFRPAVRTPEMAFFRPRLEMSQHLP